MKLRSGGLKMFPLGEPGTENKPEVNVVSFASNWRESLDPVGLQPVAVGMAGGIGIWHEKKTNWDLVFEEKCTGGVKVLSWHVGADTGRVLKLAYADGSLIKLASFDNVHDYVYKQSTIYTDGLGREASCLSWKVNGYLAAMLPTKTGNSDCLIFNKLSTKTQELKTNDVGTIAKFVPFLDHLLIGGPRMNHVQIYSKQSDSKEKRPKPWFFYTRIICEGGVSEISVYAPDDNPDRHMVAILGISSGVHLYEFKSHLWTTYALTSPDSDKIKLRKISDLLQTIKIERAGVLPLSVAWESFKTIAVFCTDGAIRTYMDTSGNNNYLLKHVLRWNSHLSHVPQTTLCIDWPQPGKFFKFDCPVLSVTAREMHGFVAFFELVDEKVPGTAPFDRDPAWELKYYDKPIASPEPEAASLSGTEDEEAEFTIGPDNKIFCNMPLKMSEIKAIGFEMDYAIVQHNSRYLNIWECEDARNMLLHDKKYMIHELLSLKHNNMMIRGLVIDKKRGNFLKMDRNNYVDTAYHGLNVMTLDQKNAVYGARATKDKFDLTDYVIMETFSSLSEGSLFATIIDFKDSHPGRIDKSYEDIYKDISDVFQAVRRVQAMRSTSVDRNNPHIMKNMQLVPMLREFRERGLKTFLLSNRSWSQTDSIMSYVCELDNTSTAPNQAKQWMEHFDIIITSTGTFKAAFFFLIKSKIYFT